MRRPSLAPRLGHPTDPDAPPVNIRAPSYFVISGLCRCWKCSLEIQVFGLGVALPFELRDGRDHWREGTKLAILTYIEHLPGSVTIHLPRLAPSLFLDNSQWHKRPYYMNHCSHCAAKVGDYETVESHSAPFNAQKFEIRNFVLSVIAESFEAVAVPYKQNIQHLLPP